MHECVVNFVMHCLNSDVICFHYVIMSVLYLVMHCVNCDIILCCTVAPETMPV
jgi:hypothetical protein